MEEEVETVAVVEEMSFTKLNSRLWWLVLKRKVKEEVISQLYTSTNDGYGDYEEEPFDFFSINFVEDTLDIDTIGLFSHPTGISVNNHLTEETMLEEDGSGSKGIMGELKLDSTKPTEQCARQPENQRFIQRR